MTYRRLFPSKTSTLFQKDLTVPQFSPNLRNSNWTTNKVKCKREKRRRILAKIRQQEARNLPFQHQEGNNCETMNLLTGQPKGNLFDVY